MTQTQSKSTLLGAAFGFGAALFFGISTPLAKILIGQVHPCMLAGLMYLGGGLGLAAIYLMGKLGQKSTAGLRQEDWIWLAISILAGGVFAPLLLMFGLTYNPASTTSLLLNFECVFTALLAWSIFRERWQIQVFFGIGAITAGSLVLTSDIGSTTLGLSWGVFAILGTCLFWALDSNLTNKIADRDPLQIAMLKSIVAGLINLVIALIVDQSLPSVPSFLVVCSVGFLTYGLSLLCFVLALRYIGASRTGAYLALSPFMGVVFSVVFLREEITQSFELAALLMAIGVGLCLSQSSTSQS